MLPSDYVNDTREIRKNPRVTAINSALEIDMSGQVCADSIGQRYYSGVGGQMDFIRGAALSEGGKPIIALPSTTKAGFQGLFRSLSLARVLSRQGHMCSTWLPSSGLLICMVKIFVREPRRWQVLPILISERISVVHAHELYGSYGRSSM